ncbi:potassium channel family protein [Solitalea sp. MAHUQ-68]|uniref:Potassium channel family protein n=1 Tax=Solitalea agri TaxID=2953739 RepID=A0A9X2F0H2_9SPHI|nr:potassium channel family protein [Solitalea agri]MCO4291874.1 potassium channel family protein [Solitalea agri]
MFVQVIISLGIIALTIVIHGLGTFYLLNLIIRRHGGNGEFLGFNKTMQVLSYTAITLMLLHYLEIGLWALAYLFIPELDKISTWEEAIYFSTVTYTTLGYGDITLPPIWRVMSGFEAMNGILLFGWSTAMFYAVVERMLVIVNKQKK